MTLLPPIRSLIIASHRREESVNSRYPPHSVHSNDSCAGPMTFRTLRSPIHPQPLHTPSLSGCRIELPMPHNAFGGVDISKSTLYQPQNFSSSGAASRCSQCGNGVVSVYDGSAVCTQCRFYNKPGVSTTACPPVWTQDKHYSPHLEPTPTTTPTPSTANMTNPSQTSAPAITKKCVHCSTTTTTLWRRTEKMEPACNACWQYYKLHGIPRPLNGSGNITDKIHHRVRGSKSKEQTTESSKPILDFSCKNCGTRETTMWRRDGEGSAVCNSCGLYFKLHGVARPLDLNRGIRRRNRAGKGKKKEAGGVDGDEVQLPSPPIDGGASGLLLLANVTREL